MKLGFILKRTNYLSSIFHVLIIAIFLLGINGCGYKGDPYYQEDVVQQDENVKFIKKESNKK